MALRMYFDETVSSLVRDDISPTLGSPDTYEGPAEGGSVERKLYLYSDNFQRTYSNVQISALNTDADVQIHYALDQNGQPGTYQTTLQLPDGDYQTPVPIWVKVTFAPATEPTLRTDLRHHLQWLEAIAG